MRKDEGKESTPRILEYTFGSSLRFCLSFQYDATKSALQYFGTQRKEVWFLRGSCRVAIHICHEPESIREKRKKSNQICKIKSSADDDDDDLRGANTKKYTYKYKCILLFVWRCLAIMFVRQIVDVYGPPASTSSAHILNLCTHATTDTTADNDAPRPNPFQVESIHCRAQKLDMNFFVRLLCLSRENHLAVAATVLRLIGLPFAMNKYAFSKICWACNLIWKHLPICVRATIIGCAIFVQNEWDKIRSICMWNLSNVRWLSIRRNSASE